MRRVCCGQKPEVLLKNCHWAMEYSGLLGFNGIYHGIYYGNVMWKSIPSGILSPPNFREYVSSHSHEYVWMIKLTYSTWLNGWYFHEYVSLTSHLAHVFRQWPSMFSVLGELLWFLLPICGRFQWRLIILRRSGICSFALFPRCFGCLTCSLQLKQRNRSLPKYDRICFVYIRSCFPVSIALYPLILYMSMFSMM